MSFDLSGPGLDWIGLDWFESCSFVLTDRSVETVYVACIFLFRHSFALDVFLLYVGRFFSPQFWHKEIQWKLDETHFNEMWVDFKLTSNLEFVVSTNRPKPIKRNRKTRTATMATLCGWFQLFQSVLQWWSYQQPIYSVHCDVMIGQWKDGICCCEAI